MACHPDDMYINDSDKLCGCDKDDGYEDIPLNNQNVQCDDEANSGLVILLTVMIQFAFIVAVFVLLLKTYKKETL